MIIAIDIDGTWTLDPAFFCSFAGFAESLNHQVIIVTGSEQPPAKLSSLGLHSATILICQRGEFKRDCALRHGFSVDVWIDNEPGTIEPQRVLQPVDNSFL